MITAQQLKEVLSEDAKWIAKDKDGDVWWYSEVPVRGHFNWSLFGLPDTQSGNLGPIDVEGFQGKHWTECCIPLIIDKELEGCLCWFFEPDMKTKVLDVLDRVVLQKGGPALYHTRHLDQAFPCCKPVRADEIKTFEKEVLK